MYLNRNDWDIIYDIENRANEGKATNDDAIVLLKLIRKMNGNIIEPKTHDAIQKLIDSLY